MSTTTSAVPVRELGRSGLKVSCLGLGCMGMSHGYGDPNKISRPDCVNLIREAFNLGINFFDTAECYGPHTNEELVGEAISTLPREKLVIATKCGIQTGPDGMVLDARPETIRASIEGSLKRLRTNYIDLYYLHRVDPKVPIEDVAHTMAELKKAGKIRHWGLSECSAATLRKAHAICPVTAVQSEYSIMHRLPEKELLPALEELGVGLVPYSPLGKAFLTGTVTSDKPWGSNDFRSTVPRLSTENQKLNEPIVDLVKEYAEKKKATPAQIALAWVLAQRPFIAPIPGTTKLHRLQENIGATAVQFTAEEAKEFNDRLNKIEVHGARYGEKAMSMLEKPDSAVV